MRGRRAGGDGLHHVAAIDVQREADVLRQRVDPQVVAGPGAGRLGVGPAELVHLVAVDALVAAAQLGRLVVLGPHGLAAAAAASAPGLVLVQGLLHRVLSPASEMRPSSLLASRPPYRPRTTSSGDQEEAVPGAVVVELEQVRSAPAMRTRRTRTNWSATSSSGLARRTTCPSNLREVRLRARTGRRRTGACPSAWPRPAPRRSRNASRSLSGSPSGRTPGRRSNRETRRANASRFKTALASGVA